MSDTPQARRGRVKSVIPGQPGEPGSGFGFLTDDEGLDRFFHFTQLFGVEIERLMPGDIVTFRPTEGERGPAAANVWPEMRPS